MARHSDPLVSFAVPRDWENKTIIAYTAAPKPGAEVAANIVMTRDRLREDEDFNDYVDRHVEELAKRIDGFTMRGDAELEVGSRPALSLSFTSNSRDGSLAQRLVMVQLPDRRVASFTLTSPQRELVQMAPLFERMLASVKFEEKA
jgi:hypothetical protein